MLVFDKENHSYTLEGSPIPGVSEILESMGMVDLSDVPVALLEYKAELGSAVHEAISLEDKGMLDDDTVTEDALPYLQAYRAFKSDYAPRTLWSEMPVFSELGYAGTADQGVEMDGELWLLDIKTGCKYRTQRLQTAAYNLILGYQKRGCLYLKKDGSYELSEHDDTSDYEVWKSLVRAFHWKKPRYSKGRKWSLQK